MKRLLCLCTMFGAKCKADATQEDLLCDPCRQYSLELRKFESGEANNTGVHTDLDTGYHGHLLYIGERAMREYTMSAVNRGAMLCMTAGVEHPYMAEPIDLTNGRDGSIRAWASEIRR